MSTAPFKRPTSPPSINQLVKSRTPLRNVARAVEARISWLDKIAVWITDRVGTMGFFLIILTWTILWLGWNLLAPSALRFDPEPAFVLWLFLSNLIQLMLMPLIMVGQNILGRNAEERSLHDLEVNVKAEHEITVVLQHLEYQNSILIAMLDRLEDDARKPSRKSAQ